MRNQILNIAFQQTPRHFRFDTDISMVEGVANIPFLEKVDDEVDAAFT